MIKGIIFDFDNTLYNYDIANNYALEYIINKLSEKFDIKNKIIQQVYNKINKHVKNCNNPSNKFNKEIYLKNLFQALDIPLKFLNEYIQLFTSKFMEKFILYDGVVELFKFLKSKNIKIGVLSNNQFFQQYTKLQNSGLIEFIDVIQTSDECGEEKPNMHMFLSIQHKMKYPFEFLAYVGDNYEHDIEPSLDLGIFPFYFNNLHDFTLLNKVIYFKHFQVLHLFFIEYFKTVNEVVFLSKYFGQSILNVQGPGGNISVKLNEMLFIKSSGCILGNISHNDGYCIVDKKICDTMISTNTNKIIDAKIYGSNVPSMETYFHSFMKKYTVHLHFTLSNIYFCSNNKDEINIEDFKYDNIVIDFFIPGIELANEIYKCYNDNCNIYFLKNHGIIITGNTISEIISYYEYIFNYFNTKLNNPYLHESICHELNKIYFMNNITVVIKHVNLPINIFHNMIICFPDMAVFVKNIFELTTLEEFKNNFHPYDIILYNNQVYCISETIIKLHSLIEILESYKTIYLHNNGNISLIQNSLQIQNMPEEKYRQSL